MQNVATKTKLSPNPHPQGECLSDIVTGLWLRNPLRKEFSVTKTILSLALKFTCLNAVLSYDSN